MSFQWVAYQSSAFIAAGTSVSVGSTNVGQALGSFTTGDLYVVAVAVAGSSADPGALSISGSGWTNQVQVGPTTTSHLRLAVWTKAAGASETGIYTVSWSATGAPAWVSWDYGAMTADAAAGQATSETSGSAIAPSCSPSGSNDTLLAYWLGLAVGTVTLPGGLTSRANVSITSNPDTMATGDKTLSASGATGNLTATFANTFKDYAAFQLAMAPAGTSTPFAPSLQFNDQPQRKAPHWIDFALPVFPQRQPVALGMLDMPAPSRKQQWLDLGLPQLYPTLAKTPTIALPMMEEQLPPLASKKQQWLDILPAMITATFAPTPVYAVPTMPDMPVASRKQQWLDYPQPLYGPTVQAILSYGLPDVSISGRKQQWLDLFLPIVPSAAAQTPSFALPMMEEMVVSYPSRKQQWLDLFLPIYGPLPLTPATAIPSMPDMPVKTRPQQWLDLFLPIVPVTNVQVTVNFVPGMLDMPVPGKKQQYWLDLYLPIAPVSTIFFGLVGDNYWRRPVPSADLGLPVFQAPTVTAPPPVLNLVADTPRRVPSVQPEFGLPVFPITTVGPSTPSNFFDTRWFDGPLPSRNSPISGQFMFEMIGIPPAVVTVTAPHYNPFLASTGRMKAIW